MNRDIILITGGDGNIAQSMVEKYLENNYMVIATDIKEKSSNDKFYNNDNYQYYKLDVTDINQIENLYKEIEKKYGKITHLISAAGMPMPNEINGIKELEIKDIDKSIQLNLTGHIYITKTFLPLIEKETDNNKTITLISSVNALKTFNLPVYSAAKAGIYGFMKSMVKELGKENIRINVISPGTVPTKADIVSNGEFYNYRYKDMLALNDFTKPEDIADTAFSLTHIMKAVTGQNIIVDSGQIS